MRIFDSRIVWIRSFVRSLKALRRYRCSRCFSRSAHAACVATVTIFLIRHLKTTYHQNYRKAFSLVFSALGFSSNKFFANKPTEFPCVWYISSSIRNLAKLFEFLKKQQLFYRVLFQIAAKFYRHTAKS